MNWGWLIIVVPVALSFAAWALRSYVDATDYRRGREALLAGRPLDPRWTSRAREGWADAWHEQARARAIAEFEKGVET